MHIVVSLSGESLNHVIKEYFEYHPERIPQMLTYLQDLILLHKKRIMGAFYGDGEWKLHHKVRHLFWMPRDEWCALSEKEKEDHFTKFCKYRPTKTVQTTIKAHNSEMEINAGADNIKTKPKDNHRIRNQKTQAKAGAPRKGSVVNKLDAMVIADLKQQYANIKAGNPITNDNTPTNDENTTSDDITTTDDHAIIEVNNTTKVAKTKQGVKKIYKCQYCNHAGYTQSHNLKKHIANLHGSKVTAV